MPRRKIYNMDRKAANKMLQNIFEACEQQPNATSFDTILFRSIANTTLVRTCKWIAIVMLFLTIASPLAFKNETGFSVGDMSIKSQVTVVSHNLYDDRFELVLSGTNIDYLGIYCKKNDGSVVMPTRSDSEIVIIPYDGEALNIFITCTDGRVVQALLSQ